MLVVSVGWEFPAATFLAVLISYPKKEKNNKFLVSLENIGNNGALCIFRCGLLTEDEFPCRHSRHSILGRLIDNHRYWQRSRVDKGKNPSAFVQLDDSFAGSQTDSVGSSG